MTRNFSWTPACVPIRLWGYTGKLNKQVGGELGVTEKTVKAHRGRLMQKLGVTSAAELVQLVQRAGLPPPVRSETKV